jgi:hypothetical protein
MIIRLEQFIGQWINLIDIPVDDYGLPEIREMIGVISAQIRKNKTTEITNPEAEFTVLVNQRHGPIHFRIMEPDPLTNCYMDI